MSEFSPVTGDFRVEVPDALYEYGVALVRTGLYGTTVSEALRRCITLGIQQAISNGIIEAQERVKV